MRVASDNDEREREGERERGIYITGGQAGKGAGGLTVQVESLASCEELDG